MTSSRASLPQFASCKQGSQNQRPRFTSTLPQFGKTESLPEASEPLTLPKNSI